MIINKKLGYRKISIIIGILLVGICIGADIFIENYYANNAIEVDTASFTYNDEEEITELNENYFVDLSFSSHLPLVVIDTDENNFSADEFTTCNIFIYDNNGKNTLLDKPTITTSANIRHRGNSSLHYAKKQYLIKLLDDNGNNKNIDIMGMGKDNTWILNGSLIDKSMMRNYLAYNVASKIMDTSMDAKYCEMLSFHEGEYEYMGVYLMLESAKRSDHRIPLRKYNPKYIQTDYILRRDRYDEKSVALNDYCYQNNLCYGVLSVKYPDEEAITDKTVKYIEDEISEFEKALYSNEPEVFVTYRDYIDIDSFIDYFLINEFFGNYDAGNNSTYMYKKVGGKLTMGPVWDFDGAIDNYYGGVFDYDSIAFQEAPWFDRMLLDPEFCHKLIIRYQELRKGVLSNEYIGSLIDNTVSYLGKAQLREWARWGKHYIDSDYLQDASNRHGVVYTNRNLNSFSEEINKIKEIVYAHGDWLDENVGTFYMKTNTVYGLNSSDISHIDEINQSSFDYGAFLAIMFMGIFIITVVLIQRD